MAARRQLAAAPIAAARPFLRRAAIRRVAGRLAAYGRSLQELPSGPSGDSQRLLTSLLHDPLSSDPLSSSGTEALIPLPPIPLSLSVFWTAGACLALLVALARASAAGDLTRSFGFGRPSLGFVQGPWRGPNPPAGEGPQGPWKGA